MIEISSLGSLYNGLKSKILLPKVFGLYVSHVNINAVTKCEQSIKHLKYGMKSIPKKFELHKYLNS